MLLREFSQLENQEFSSQAASYSFNSQDTSKAGCSPCDSQDVSRDEFSGSEGSDLVAGQVLQMKGDSSADSSPRHHKPAHSGLDYDQDLPSNERSIINRNLKANLVAKGLELEKLPPSE